MPSFGERLRELRLNRDITQEELAGHFGLHKTRISQYELNKRQADDEMKKKLAQYFDVSLDYLMGKSNIKESADKLVKTDIRNIQETTIALHSDHDYEDLPEEARKEVDNFIEYVRNKYQK